MYLKQTATTKTLSAPINRALFGALFLLAAMLLLPTSATAQQMRLNVGCPSLGSPNIGQYTIDELNALCHNNTGTTHKPEQVSAAEDGAALSCGQHKALAAFARMNPGFVEGQTSQAVVDKYCQNTSDTNLPSGSQVGGDLLSGVFQFERGYYTSYSGSKGRICKSRYAGTAYLNKGKIEFTSGGHTWRGSIAQNSYVSITRDGVTPRPKNHTVISGPMLNADLYNGYCGAGYFRLLAG